MIKTIDVVSVTATGQRVTMPDPSKPHTLRNVGSQPIAYFYNVAVPLAATLAGTEAVMRGLGASFVYPGEYMVLEPDFGWLDVACPTGLTSKLVIEAGRLVGGAGGPAFTEVNALAGAAATTSLVGTPGANKQLWVYAFTTSFLTAAGTVTLKSDTAAKWGPMGRGKNGGDSLGWDSGPNAKPIFKCATDKALKITTTGGSADCQIMLRYRVVDV